MAGPRPNFIDSPYYVSKPGGGGYLKPGAPAAVQKEFDDFMREDEAEDVELPTITAADLNRL